MPADAQALVDQLYAAFAAVDLDAIEALYETDAVIVRHDGSVQGRPEIRAFWERYLSNHQPYELDQIVAFRHEHDIVLWDAIVTTDAGKLLTYHVVVLAEDGAVTRHVPLIRGYWGL
jgi:ketosteroid isomerase-like protein